MIFLSFFENNSGKIPFFFRNMKTPAAQCAAKASKKFNIWIEFVPDAVNAFDIIRRIWYNFELAPEIADMIVNGSAGIVVQIFVPYKVHDHVVGEYPVGIHDNQSEDIELFCRQFNLRFMDIHLTIFQAKV